VVGAGVGGLAAALSLDRAGWQVLVCERAPARRTGGYFVRLAPSGLDAASRLGVDGVLHTRLPADGVITGVDGRGRTVSRVDASLSDDGVSLALVRSDLERALWAALPDAVEVRFSTGPLAIHQGPLVDVPVRVLLGDPAATPGTYAEDVDLVVGADGVRSTVRGLVFGPEGEFRHEFDHVVVSAVLPRLPGHLVEGDYVVLVEPGRTAHLMAMSGHRPVVFFTYRADRPELAGAGASGETVADLRAVYGDFRGLMPEILAGVEEAGTTHADTVGQIHLERWSRGRVVLLGDAAWCPTLYSGYGSALALSGGEALGRHLAERPDDVIGALGHLGARPAARRRPGARRGPPGPPFLPPGQPHGRRPACDRDARRLRRARRAAAAHRRSDRRPPAPAASVAPRAWTPRCAPDRGTRVPLRGGVTVPGGRRDRHVTGPVATLTARGRCRRRKGSRFS